MPATGHSIQTPESAYENTVYKQNRAEGDKNCLPIKREPRSRLWQPFGNAHAYQCECGATVTTQSRLVDICLVHKWP